MYDTRSAQPRVPRTIGRFFRRVRWMLIVLFFAGAIALEVWLNTISLHQFAQEKPVFGAVTLAQGGLGMLVASFSLLGKWKPGRKVEFWMRTLPWLWLFFPGFQEVLLGATFFTRLDPQILLWGTAISIGGMLLTLGVEWVLWGLLRRRQAAQRAAHQAFLVERVRHRAEQRSSRETEAAADPTSVQRWISQGQRSLGEQCYPEALTAFDQAVDLDAHAALAHLGQGHALARLGQYAEALLAYEQAWRLDPALTEALARQATMHSALGQPGAGLELAEEAIQRDPTRALTYVTKGTALLRLLQVRAALRAYWTAWRVSRRATHQHAGSAA